MAQIDLMLSEVIAEKIKELKFKERIMNTVDWSIQDFDHNFKKVIQELLNEILKEYIESKKDIIKELFEEQLETSIEDKIRKAINDFDLVIPRPREEDY